VDKGNTVTPPRKGQQGQQQRRPWQTPSNADFVPPDGQQQQRTEIIRTDPSLMTEVGQRLAHGDPARLRDAMGWLQEHTNLILPVTAVDAVPAGYRLAMSAVLPTSAEVYRNTQSQRREGQPPTFSMHRPLLDRIANAAGLSCVPELCMRIDTGKDPLYVCCQAAGKLRGMDGADHVYVATRALDLHDGSPAVIDLLASASSAATGEKQLRRTRAFIVEHTETKAWSRLVRRVLGLRHEYSAEDLSKPFIAGRLVWTGDFGDPETNRAVALLTASKALGMGDALFRAVGSMMTGGMGILPDMRGAAPPVTHVVDEDEHGADHPADLPDDDGWDGPGDDEAGNPGASPPPGEPTPRAGLDDLVKYAKSKGKLGNGAGLITEAQIRALSPLHQCRLWSKLDDVEDDPIPW
jgi:hypothetical protein